MSHAIALSFFVFVCLFVLFAWFAWFTHGLRLFELSFHFHLNPVYFGRWEITQCKQYISERWIQQPVQFGAVASDQHVVLRHTIATTPYAESATSARVLYRGSVQNTIFCIGHRGYEWGRKHFLKQRWMVKLQWPSSVIVWKDWNPWDWQRINGIRGPGGRR